MKKSFLSLFTVLLLASCAGRGTEAAINQPSFTPYAIYNELGLPEFHTRAEASHSTYLMMSRYGRVDGVAGVDVAEPMYVENCVIWITNPGDKLPEPERVSSTVTGATFRGWYQYNGNIYPDKLEYVPEQSGQKVFAIFDGPTGGGGSSGGGGDSGGDTTQVTFTVTGLPTWVTDDGCIIFAWVWGGGAGNGVWAKLNYTSETEATFLAPTNITGFNMARCVSGTTAPDWEIKSGDNPGRIYNKSGDVTVYSSTKTYSSPAWVTYPGE